MTRQFKISDFLKRIKNQIDINDSVKYKRVTVSGNHNGVSLRDEVLGSAIGTKKQFTIKGGNFILSKIDARNGAFGIIPAELNNAIITGNFWTYSVDTKLIDIEWFFYFTHSYNFIQICIESSTGSTHRKYMDEKVFLNHKIILPAIVEQKEMVKKYKNSSKISNNLTSEIESQKKLLTQLKQSILQEAIQGKLTADWRALRQAQDSPIEPASELLKRIKAEKAQLIKDKKIKKEKALPPIKAEEIPFELPEGWVWCRLGDVAEYVQRGKSPKYVESSSIPVISQKCVQWGRFDFHKARFINESTLDKYEEERFLRDGDLLWNSTGDGTVGRLIEFVNDTGYDKIVVDSHVAIVRLMKTITPKFILSYLSTKDVQDNLSVSGSTKQTELSKTTVLNHLVPLAPVEEQIAIVEKVESLMQKCQALEQEIKASEANAQMLMQAVLKEAFAGKQTVVTV